MNSRVSGNCSYALLCFQQLKVQNAARIHVCTSVVYLIAL